MAQREPVIDPTDDDLRSAPRKRAELQRLLDELENRTEPMTLVDRARLIQVAKGAFADVPTSSAEFIRRKHRELDAEEALLRGESGTP